MRIKIGTVWHDLDETPWALEMSESELAVLKENLERMPPDEEREKPGAPRLYGQVPNERFRPWWFGQTRLEYRDAAKPASKL
jgi:hypothetical protein